MSKTFLKPYIVFQLAVCFAIAQKPIIADSINYIELPFEQISQRQGLSQGMIFHAALDHNGYIWAATKDGLNRYDGTGFKVFRNDPDDTLSISDNYCTYVYEDSKNRLWIGTHLNGLELYDPKNESFIHFRPDTNNPNNLISNYTTYIQEDLSGNIIIECQGIGAVAFKIKPGAIGSNINDYDMLHLSDMYPILKSLPVQQEEIYFKKFFKDGSFCAHIGDTMYAYSASMIAGREKPAVVYCPYILKVNFESGFFNFGLDDNSIYVCPTKQELKKFNPVSKTFETVLMMPEGFSFYNSIFIDSKNRVWTWKRNGDLLRIKLDDGNMTVIYTTWENVDFNVRHPIKNAFQDDDNNIWLPTAGYGFLKLKARSELFKKVSNEEFLNSTKVWHYHTEQPGTKASFNNTILQKWKMNASKNNWEEKHMQLEGRKTHIVPSSNGFFWLLDGSRNSNTYVLNSQNANSSYEIIAQKDFNEDNWFGYPSFLDNQGELWFGESGNKNGINLYHYSENSKKMETYPIPAKADQNQNRFISDYYQDIDGVFWLGTVQGLFRFQPSTKSWQHFVNKPGNKSSLSFNLVLSVCPDPAEPKRFLWVGTEGGGLNKFDINSQTFTRYSTDNGLPNNVIYGVLSDKHNNLWLSTNNGLCLFNPQTLEVRIFTMSDGLVSNEFNRYEFSKTSDGTLYFGTPSGINFFQPEDFYVKSEPSRIIINQLKVLNKPVDFHHTNDNADSTSYYLPAPIEQCHELIFNHDIKMISIGFALLDLTTPAENKFKYMLEGFDKTWIDAGNSNEAIYTNLYQGKYIFKVIGCNRNNIWNTKPAVLQITILPPWWGTWWFRILIPLLITSLIYSLYRFRLVQALKLERLRNQIAQDLHDEIGSTLSSISLYSTVMQKTSGELPAKTNNILNKIIENTSTMMESMNDMVWTIKSDNDSFEHVVNRMRAFSVNMTEMKDINLNFNAAKDAEKQELNMSQRKNFYLIFKEAVNNSVKYSGCQNLDIYISYHNKKIMMSIKDDGCGFDSLNGSVGKTLLGGNGIKGMKLRANEINAELNLFSEPGKGTVINLTLLI